jgi:hypothetical protein
MDKRAFKSISKNIPSFRLRIKEPNEIKIQRKKREPNHHLLLPPFLEALAKLSEKGTDIQSTCGQKTHTKRFV